MPDYRVVFTPAADDEILKSYEWGARFWGEDAAIKWLREVYSVVFRRLSQFPFSCSLAPEGFEIGREIRHLILGRYRILFKVKGDTVIVLQLAGPFRDSSDSNLLPAD